ncbi:hypothetical protein QYF61_012657 [Mycteria americana]|uniref:Uncharacterized protein n=1 Tax=Mycteria americana TaxID=33587 RepID=A0AAN7MYI5_MYCAM|nr:hypothetical protein QYF61_012657 [Mycteria americana]
MGLYSSINSCTPHSPGLPATMKQGCGEAKLLAPLQTCFQQSATCCIYILRLPGHTLEQLLGTLPDHHDFKYDEECLGNYTSQFTLDQRRRQRLDPKGKAKHGWRLNRFPGQPVPMLDNPFSEEKFPNIQSKPPLTQLEAISSCPITCYLGEETDPHLSTTSFQATQSQLPQPLLIRLLLQTLHQLRCPCLDTLQHLNVPLVVGGPNLNTVFEAAFQPLFPKPVALHGVAVAQVQDLALSLVEPHTIDLIPLIQPVQVPLQSLPPLKKINTPTQLGVICKLTESTLDPFVQIIDKDVKQNWPQHRALGNTACDWPPTGVNSIHHHSLGPAVQPVLYPAKSTPVQAMSSQFLQENAVGNRVKGFTEV